MIRLFAAPVFVVPEAMLASVFLQDHPDQFRSERRFTFHQVYLSLERHRGSLAGDAGELLRQLKSSNRSDTSTLGDPSLLENQLANVEATEVAKQFGEKFASALNDLPLGEWQGPVESSYGIHLVFVDERTERRSPPLEEVRDAVRREWLDARRLKSNKKIKLLAVMWLVAFGHNAFAHEVRPAYLEFRQTGPEVYDVPWKVPALGEDARLAIYIELPEGTHDVAAPRSTFNGGAFFERRSIRRDGGLNGHSIAIEGLSATATDVLVRIESLDGATQNRTAFADEDIVRRSSCAKQMGGRRHISAPWNRAYPARIRSSFVRAGLG